MPSDPRNLTPDELAWVLEQLPIVESWIKAVYATTLERLKKGQKVPGYKLVWGRSTRMWQDEAKAAKVLARITKQGLDVIMPRSMIGIPDAEKLLRKKILGRILRPAEQKMFDALIRRSTPNMHIAPNADPRKALTRGEAFAHVPSMSSAPKRKV